VAQLVAHSLWERGAASSSLAIPTSFLKNFKSFKLIIMKKSLINTNPNLPNAIFKISKIIFAYFIKNPNILYIKIPISYCDTNTVIQFELDYDKSIEALKAGTFKHYLKAIEWEDPLDSERETINSMLSEIDKGEPNITPSDKIQSPRKLLYSILEETFPENTPCNSDSFIRFCKTTKHLREKK
jgi:hypothetical protein